MLALGETVVQRSVCVFLNPKSGTAEGVSEQIEQLFAEAGCLCAVQELRAGLDLAGVLRPGQIAVAAGGDGTVNAVANAVLMSGHAMAVLPVGTLNHFAHDLNVPLELPEAVELTATGIPTRVDAAEVNGTVFVNNSSLGFYPAMVMDRERLKRGGWNKWFSLAWASLRAFARFRCLRIELTLDGRKQQHRTPFLFVGNNEYCMEGSQIGTRESIAGGRLFLCLASGTSRIDLLRLALAATAGRLHVIPEFQQISTDQFSVLVHSRHRLRVSVDGEVRRMKGPLHYRVLPGALQVIRPA